MNYERDKAYARDWARKQLEQSVGTILLLDSETTDLYGEIIELAIIDLSGNALYNRRFNPLSVIQPGAQAIHGLTVEMLVNEPRWSAEIEIIRALVASAEKVLIYNASFDIDCLGRTCYLHSVPGLTFKTGCLMEMYAQWFGQWSSYRRSYKWQRLTGGDHSALGDCRAALAALREMAELETEQTP